MLIVAVRIHAVTPQSSSHVCANVNGRCVCAGMGSTMSGLLAHADGRGKVGFRYEPPNRFCLPLACADGMANSWVVWLRIMLTFSRYFVSCTVGRGIS